MRYFREPVSYATMPNRAAKSAETFLAPLQGSCHGLTVTEGLIEVRKDSLQAWAPPPGELAARLTEGVRFYQTSIFIPTDSSSHLP